MRTFGILVFTIGLMGLFIWYLLKKPKRFHGADDGKENLVTVDEDLRKAQLVGNSVIDF